MDASNTSLRRALIVTIIIGSALCMVLAAYLILHKPPETRSSLTVHAAALHAVKGKRTTVNAGLPTRLKIPSIGVDAALDSLGLTAEGDLAAPKEPANAGWYNQGPRPGDSGNAVIDGHFGYKNNQPAVFDNLHKLVKGDKIHVEDEKGTTVSFVVRELRTYKPGEDTESVFRSADGKSHLNLITCKGFWDKTQRSYSARLVVYSDKENL